MTTIEIICTVIGAIATILGGMYYIFNFVFTRGKDKEHLTNFEKNTMDGFAQINKRFDEVDHRIDKQETETKSSIARLENKFDKRLDKFGDGINKVRDTVQEHTTALVEIYTLLGRKYPKRGEAFAQKNSPRKLTELGKKIFNDINGEKFLNDNKDCLFEYIDEHKPLTRLDVEELAMQALFRQTSKPVFNNIKDYVYEAPAYKNVDGEMSELTVGDVCYILSIPLRDMYLKERNFK